MAVGRFNGGRAQMDADALLRGWLVEAPVDADTLEVGDDVDSFHLYHTTL